MERVISTSTITNTTSTTTTFDHAFSGLSVWVEPCPDESHHLVNEMSSLAQQCGGVRKGLHSFVPHCTMLYNISGLVSRDNDHRRRSTGREGRGGLPLNKNCDAETLEVGLELLEKCVEIYQRRKPEEGEEEEAQEEDNPEYGSSINSEPQTQTQTQTPLGLFPELFYYFHYPKAADDGRGFGCSISLLLLKNTPQLQLLHNAVVSVFPSDERHGKARGKFIPHMAMVYAPESKGEFLRTKTRNMEKSRRYLLKPLRARYLSLWSTKGRLKDWYRIAKVEIPRL